MEPHSKIASSQNKIEKNPHHQSGTKGVPSKRHHDIADFEDELQHRLIDSVSQWLHRFVSQVV